jgi:hypothetical protein
MLCCTTWHGLICDCASSQQVSQFSAVCKALGNNESVLSRSLKASVVAASPIGGHQRLLHNNHHVYAACARSSVSVFPDTTSPSLRTLAALWHLEEPSTRTLAFPDARLANKSRSRPVPLGMRPSRSGRRRHGLLHLLCPAAALLAISNILPAHIRGFSPLRPISQRCSLCVARAWMMPASP